MISFSMVFGIIAGVMLFIFLYVTVRYVFVRVFNHIDDKKFAKYIGQYARGHK
jgi:hypothetical protein